MFGDMDRQHDKGCYSYETQMAEEVNELLNDLKSSLHNCEPRRIGDKLLDFLLCLIRAARKLGSRVFDWFILVNQELFCDVILICAAIAQKQVLDQVRLSEPMRRFDYHTFYNLNKDVDLRNMSLVYYIIDYVRTFNDWGVGGLQDFWKKLSNTLLPSHWWQSMLRYLTTVLPHIHGGSWIVLYQARRYLKAWRTFGDYRRSMNPSPNKLNEVVKTHAAKALLDVYQTENAARYRVLLNSADRKRVAAKHLDTTNSRYLKFDRLVNLQQLDRRTRQNVVRECQQFWAHDEIVKLKRWLDDGLPAVHLVRGMFHFSGLCMYPSSRLIDKFLRAALKTKSGLDGDEVVGNYLEYAIGRPQIRTPVKVFDFFSLDGISFPHLCILCPMLSRENTCLVQKKFNDLTKYGYKYNLWKNYKSFLRYGFRVNVNSLSTSKHLKSTIRTFIKGTLPKMEKDQSVFLYAHLTNCHRLSELPLKIIFQFHGIDRSYEYAREKMEKKRQKYALQQKRYLERKGRKIDNDNKGSSPRNCIEQSTLTTMYQKVITLLSEIQG